VTDPRPRLAARASIGAIRGYQFFSRAMPPRCRFYPSCSEYTAQALEMHGFWRGIGLGARRLGRCHPWGGSGVDPVPNTCSHRRREPLALGSDPS